MILERFGLSARPFASGPDPSAYYPSAGHEEVINDIHAAIIEGEPCILLTGDSGVGKTILAQIIMARLGEDTATALITNCHFSCRGDLLQAMLYELGLPHTGKSEQEMRIALTEYLIGRHLEGRKTVLVLDEAQLLTPELLEEVRLLGNLESPKGKAVQVILIAQPEILATLELPQLACFVQRLMVRVRLEPMGLRDSAGYLAHHLLRAGGRPDAVFTEEAVEVLCRGCRGVPRLLNQAGRAALSVTAKAGLKVVDAEGATEALAAMPHIGPLDPEPSAPSVFTADESDSVLASGDEPVATDNWAAPFSERMRRFEFTPAQ